MCRLHAVGFVGFCVVAAASSAFAQPPSTRIGPFVIDIRGTIPRFPTDATVAESRGLNVNDLPGTGIGVAIGAHLYLLKWRAITLGIGGEFMTSRAHSSESVVNGQVYARAVTERLTSLAPQLSFNFGSAKGWSYLSGGIARSTWSIVPDGLEPTPGDEEKLKTINYGGGARWFAKKHLAFTFDVRFYAVNPGTPQLGFPGTPRTTLFVGAAGVAIR
jgi:hypothetical protein